MGRDEVDEKALTGLRGIVRISRTTLNGRRFLNLGGFAPASEWDELSGSVASSQEVRIQNSTECLREDNKIQSNGPIAYIPRLDLDTVLQGRVISPAHLPESRHTRPGRDNSV
jgi:hypothetical protein